MERIKIDLHEIMQTTPFERPLIVAARTRNIDAMVQRFEAGACVATIANVLHYSPEVLPEVLAAIDRLEPAQREFNSAVLWEIGLRLRGDQMQVIRPWRAAQAARLAIEQSNQQKTLGRPKVTLG